MAVGCAPGNVVVRPMTVEVRSAQRASEKQRTALLVAVEAAESGCGCLP
jgi:hypothetical protein